VSERSAAAICLFTLTVTTETSKQSPKSHILFYLPAANAVHVLSASQIDPNTDFVVYAGCPVFGSRSIQKRVGLKHQRNDMRPHSQNSQKTPYGRGTRARDRILNGNEEELLQQIYPNSNVSLTLTYRPTNLTITQSTQILIKPNPYPPYPHTNLTLTLTPVFDGPGLGGNSPF